MKGVHRILAVWLLAAGMALAGETAPPEQLARAVESAHGTLWSKFIGADGLIHDYVGELPTPEECALGKPNAIGWWSPIENGPMFTGTYLAAMCERARRSAAGANREKARRLARGLIVCASVSDVPGFIARGMGSDGKCHYPMGSQDQTHPWFYGLHAYATSGIPDADIDQRQLWIYVSSQGGLARLADWETDEHARAQYRAGLAINARGALAAIETYKTFDNNDTKIFGHARWREGYPAWFPQKTQADAGRMASTGDRKILGERKHYEASRMRNPLAAAALIALAGHEDGFDAVRRAICHYDYAKLNMAEFFLAECAYYALPVERGATGDRR